MNESAKLAYKITKSSSKQTFFIIKILVDENLRDDCYRAYAYFRWADDMVDVVNQSDKKKIRFIERQNFIADELYAGNRPNKLTLEEKMLADLINNDNGSSGLLKSYIYNFLTIIKFDAIRQGNLINEEKLEWYACTLGQAVTDGIQYFVCNGHPYRDSNKRYLAATAAHITHMLRDTKEDLLEGYYNFYNQGMEGQNMDQIGIMDGPDDDWVRYRVNLARRYFYEGKKYLDCLDALRCKIVGHLYCLRFERILDIIEEDGFQLREKYPSEVKVAAWIKYGWKAVNIAFLHLTRIILNQELWKSNRGGPIRFIPGMHIDDPGRYYY